MDPVTIRSRTPDGVWTTLGVDRETGVVPESITMAADEAGPSTLGFTIRRDPRIVWDDLQPGNQIEVESQGSVVWGGRINQTPGAGRASSSQITVSAQGWRAHLDDDQIDKGWVHAKTSAWRDGRTFATTNIGFSTKVGKVVTGGGAAEIGWAKGDTVSLNNTAAIVLDLGPGRTGRRFVISYERSGGQADTLYFIRSNASENVHDPVNYEDVLGAPALTTLGTTGVITGTFAGLRRYMHIGLIYVGAGGAFVTDITLKFPAIKVFPSIRDEASNEAILKASDVVKDVLGSGALPLLDQSTALVDPTSFVIPEFWPDGYRTPGEILSAVNAFHDYRLGVTADRRLFFRARPVEPLYAAGEWSGDAFSDSSLGNLDALYNRVIVEYTGADGAATATIRTASTGILTRQGLTRAKRLPVQATLTAAAANQIGDVWLAKHSASAPLSGSITVRPGDVRSTQTGMEIHPALLLAATGERIRLEDRSDPETGGVGRVGTMVNVTYNPASEEATIQLDNDTSSLEGFLGRLAVIQGAG